MTDEDRKRDAAMTVQYAMKCNLEGTQPKIRLDTETAEYAVGFASGVALTWMRNWHRLALLFSLTPEAVAAINANPEINAAIEKFARQHIENATAQMLLSGIWAPEPDTEAQDTAAPHSTEET